MADGKAHTLGRLAESLGRSGDQVSDAAGLLANRDFLIVVSRGEYRLTKEGKAAAAAPDSIAFGSATGRKRAGGFRSRCWRAMRVRRQFTMSDILMDGADGEADPYGNLHRYLRALRLAGYVRELPTRRADTKPFSGGLKRFRLEQDTGPKAPVFSKVRKCLFDPNIGKDVSCEQIP